MSNNRRWGGSREGAGRPNTKAKGTRSIRSYYDVQVPGEPRVALQVAATEVEVAATAKAASEKNAKEKAATDRRELIQMELRERREQDLRNQKNGLEVLAEAAATENNGGTTGFHIEEEEEESDHESDDESWDSDNEEEDDDDEESPDNEPRTNKKRRNRQAYKPQPGSDFHAYLNEIKTKILSGEDKEFVKGKHEYPPMKDPLVKPHNTNATDWYESQYQVYVWYPFLQYKASCQLKDFHCIHCKEKTLESKGYDVRPMFSFDKVYYCNHRRVRCNSPDCRKTFAEIDPRFLPQFPTVILDRFKFMTTIKGYGVDTMLLYHFANLHCTGTAPGRYVKSLNEMLKLKYHMDWATYMDSLTGFSQHQEALGLEATTILQPFKPFHSPGFYNGILLPRSLFTKCYLEFVKTKEPRLQASFQTCCDEGAVADHTHKYSRRIHLSGREGKPFEASYSVMAMKGKMNKSRMTSGKSNDEVEPIVKEYREVRLKAGFPELKSFCGDGGPDRAVWKKGFKELKTGIKPYTPTHMGGYPVILEDIKNILVLLSKEKVRDWALSISEKIRSRPMPQQEEKIYVSIDCEWNQGDSKETTRALQIKWPDWIEPRPVVIHLSSMGILTADDFVSELRDVLQFPTIVGVGVMIMFDTNRLRCLGVDIKSSICLRALGKVIDPDVGGYDMQNLCKRYLNCTVDKTSARSDWTENPLPRKLVLYAATDVKVAMRLLEAMKPLGEEVSAESEVLSPYGNNRLKPDAPVVYYINGVDCARGKIVHVGDQLEKRPYGTLVNIPPGKVLVRLTSVIRWSTRPMESYNPTNEEKKRGVSGWKYSKTTLQRIWSWWKEKKQEPLLVLPLGCIKIPFSPSDDIIPAVPSKDDATGTSPCNDGEDMDQVDGHPSFDDHLDDDTQPAVEQADDDSSLDAHLDDDTLPASKDKGDVFHQFQSFPMQRGDPNYTLVTRLLIHTTFDMDPTDFRHVAAHLATTEGIHSTEELLDHFYYNREWWRRRVKMSVPDRETHAQAVRNLHEFVKKFILSYDAKVADYFDSFEREIQEGLYDELNELQMYDEDGQDSHGLNLYYSRRGSNRVELYHRFLMLAIGPTIYGPEIAHYLMVLVTARFNVNTGVVRCGEYDFGHPWHEFIDRIHIRHMQLFGCNIFPKHKNLLLTETVPDIVAVGFGPVSFDTDYVEPSDEPHQNLTGNRKWLAKKMKVKQPPLNVAGKREKTICNDFFRDNPKPTTTKLRELARIFKAESNGIDVFPKLVSQLRTYYGQWKSNNAIRLVGAKIREPYQAFLSSLANLPELSPTGLRDRVEAEAEEITREAAGLLQHDESPLVGVTCEMNPHPVAPAAAPDQTNFVPVIPILQHNRIRGSNENSDSCFYYPYCLSLVCGGGREGMCKFVNSGDIVIEDVDEFLEEKEGFKRQQKAARARDRRRGIKRSRNLEHA
jgi:hypothetical protein